MPLKTSRIEYLRALCRTAPFHIAEAVLTRPDASAVAPEQFVGAALFIDIVGFTALSERWLRDERAGFSRLASTLSDYFRRLIEHAVFPFDGYVVHFGGDSTTIVFRGEDATLRAAHTAWAALAMSENRESDETSPIRIRLGLATGPMQISVIGDPLQRAAFVTGDAHRAVAMQGIASPGEVVIDDNSRRQLGEYAAVQELEPGAYRLAHLTGVVTPRPSPIPIEAHLASQTEEKIALLEPFVPPPLAARLRSMPDGWRMESELRRVVVLFFSIDGFVNLPEVDKSKTALAFLQAFRRFGGVVMKPDLAEKGHRILAVFGLHAPTENDPERAVLAALDAMRALRQLARVARNRGKELDAYAGVHVGNVVYGAIGSELRHDITLLGDTVNIAARCAGQAGPFEIVSTRELAEEVRSELVTADMGPISVKGKQEPLSLVQIKAAISARAHYVQQRESPRPYAGRKPELMKLTELCERASSNQGMFVTITGEAGTGKSYLLSHVIDAWVSRGGVGMVGQCRYATRHVPFAPVSAMLAQYLGVFPESDAHLRRQQVEDALSAAGLGRAKSEIASLLERTLFGGSEVTLPIDEYARERLLSTVARFVARRIQEEPVLYILENLHNADVLTVETVRRVVGLARDGRFLFVATARPGERIDSLAEHVDAHIVTRDLSHRHSADMIRLFFDADRVDEQVTSFLWARTHGNPGQLREWLQFLRERGLLVVRAGEVVAPEPGIAMLDDTIPHNLSSLALAQVEQLGELERRVLRTASIVGKASEAAVLEHVLADDLVADEVSDGLASLVSAGFLTSERGQRHAYRFHHDAIRVVTYRSVPEDERRDAHRKIADVLEQTSDRALDQAAVAIAAHRERAGQLDRSHPWFARATHLAAQAGMDGETEHLVQRWQAVIQQLPEEQRPPSSHFATMSLYRLMAVAQRKKVDEVKRLAGELLEQHGQHLDAATFAQVDLWYIDALLASGEYALARARLGQLGQSSLPTRLCMDVAWLNGRLRFVAGDYAAAVTAFSGGLSTADDELRSSRLRIDLALAHMLQGDFDEGRLLVSEVLDEARRREQVSLNASATACLARADFWEGDFEDARTGLEAARVMHRALGHRGAEAEDELYLGQLALVHERFEEAHAHLDKVMGIASELGDHQLACESAVHLGLVRGIREDPKTGLASIERTLTGGSGACPVHVQQVADLHRLRLAVLVDDPLQIERLRHRCQSMSSLVPIWESVRSKWL